MRGQLMFLKKLLCLPVTIQNANVKIETGTVHKYVEKNMSVDDAELALCFDRQVELLNVCTLPSNWEYLFREYLYSIVHLTFGNVIIIIISPD